MSAAPLKERKTAGSSPILEADSPPCIFTFPGSAPSGVYQEALTKLGRSHLKIEEFSENPQFFQNRKKIQPALFLLSLENRTDILTITNLISEIHQRDWHWKSQLLIISGVDHPKLSSFFVKRNCAVISRKFTTAIAFKNRIEQQITLLQIRQSQVSKTSILETAYQIHPSHPFLIQWNHALLIEDDLWFVPLERFVHHHNGEWTVLMLGPNPSSGEWILLEPALWKWKPRFDPFSKNKKSTVGWHFKGEKPQFYNDQWKFSGSAIELYFITSSDRALMKFQTYGNTQIAVAANSPHLIHQLNQTSQSQGTSDLHLEKSTEKTGNTSKIHLNKNPIFRTIDDLILIREFLAFAFREQASLLVWQKHSKVRLTGTLASFQTHSNKITIQLSQESFDFIKKHDNWSNQNPFYGTFNIDLGCVFFSSMRFFTDHDQRSLIIYPERVFFHVQRRKDNRLKYHPKMPIKISIPGSPTVLTNISEKGIGLKFRKFDYETFKAAPNLEAILKLDHHLIICKLAPKWKKTIITTGDEWVHAGFTFQDLSELDHQTLQLFIFEQNIPK